MSASATPSPTPSDPAAEPLPGYKPIQQMVYCDFYPGGKTQYEELRDAMDRLQLNDSSFTFAPESSDALGFGFRCGFLGLLHMEIIQERLEREFNIEVVQTAPTVTYEILLTDGTVKRIDAPSELPNPTHVEEIREPYILMNLILPGRQRRRADEAVRGPPRHLQEDRIHRHDPRDPGLRDAAGRGDLRFLRPAQEPPRAATARWTTT